MKTLKIFRIKSLYIKWILLFTGLIIISQFFTLALIFRFVLPEFISFQNEKLYTKSVLVKNLYEQGFLITNDTLNALGDNDIYFSLLNLDNENKIIGEHSASISEGMLEKVKNGEIVSSLTDNEMSYKDKFYIVGIGDKIAFISHKIDGNISTLFINAIQRSIFLGAFIGSIFIVLALIVIIHPLRKVISATKEVAGGNFNIQVKTKSVDEVGQLIENFNIMTRELKKNEYLKKDFVSSVSHEFKTPIMSIEGFTKMLKNTDLTPEQFDDYTDIIIKETRRLSNLSSNLLKLSLLDSSTLEPTKTKFYIDEQIRNVILLLESQWSEKDIDFDINMCSVLFYGNEELLSQVWINLIQNAIKFSEYGGLVSVSLEKTKENIRVSITNYGIGISEKHKEHIFNRFYKADEFRSKEGNGLGLSIVKKIIELSKGNISFFSETSKATTFVVVLPTTLINKVV